MQSEHRDHPEQPSDAAVEVAHPSDDCGECNPERGNNQGVEQGKISPVLWCGGIERRRVDERLFAYAMRWVQAYFMQRHWKHLYRQRNQLGEKCQQPELRTADLALETERIVPPHENTPPHLLLIGYSATAPRSNPVLKKNKGRSGIIRGA